MNNVLTIDLAGATPQVTTTPTFDQAFLGEDFSNLKGKGRAKRKKRKLSRISDRDEVRRARQDARLDRQSDRKSKRQETRDEQQQARLDRRMTRQTSAQDRKDMRKERKDAREPEEEELDDTLDQSRQPDEALNDGYDDDGQPSYDDGSDDTDSGSGDYDTDEEVTGDDGSNFMGEATGKNTTKVHPVIQDICFRIEWNNELMSRVKQKRDQVAKQGGDTSKMDATLSERYSRNKQLEGKLENFSGADGNSDKRMAMIKEAKRRAKTKRMMLHQPKDKGVSIATKDKTSSMTGDGINVDYLPSLPEEDPFYLSSDYNEYEVTSSMDGDTAFDYFSGDASPSKTGLGGLTALMVGAIVGFGAIYLIGRYKLLK